MSLSNLCTLEFFWMAREMSADLGLTGFASCHPGTGFATTESSNAMYNQYADRGFSGEGVAGECLSIRKR